MKKLKVLMCAVATISLSSSWAFVLGNSDESNVLIEQGQSGDDQAAVGDSLPADFDFDNEEFQAMFKKLEEQMNKAKENLPEEKRLELERMENEVKELGIKLNNLHTELADFTSTKAAHKDEVKALRERIAGLEKDKAELVASIEKITLEIASAEGDQLADRQNELVVKKADLEKIEAEIAEKTTELEGKRAVKKEVKGKIQSHEAEIAATEEEMNKKNQEAQAASPFGGDDFDFEKLFGDISDGSEGEIVDNQEAAPTVSDAENFNDVLGIEEESAQAH